MKDDGLLYSVLNVPPAVIIARMLAVLYPDAKTVLDATYGRGKFWNGYTAVNVTALDLDPHRARDVCGDFQALPFRDDAFDVVIFDPPYQTDMGRGKPSVMGSRFGTFPTITDLRLAVGRGTAECHRVGRLGIIVKCQDYIHGSTLVEMTQWVRSVVGTPYDVVHGLNRTKMRDPKWTEQLSAWRVHSTYMSYRWDGWIHKRRGRRHSPQGGSQ